MFPGSPKCRREIQEILQEIDSPLREKTFRVKLDTVQRVNRMANPHDFPFDSGIIRPSGDDQIISDGVGRDAEAVIASGSEGVWQSSKHSLSVVKDLRDLSMHEARCSDDGFVVNLGHTLMPQADPQNWYEGSEFTDDFLGDSCFVGSARAWRNDDSIGFELANLINGSLVVASNSNIETRVDFTEPLDEVIREGVVIVD